MRRTTGGLRGPKYNFCKNISSYSMFTINKPPGKDNRSMRILRDSFYQRKLGTDSWK